MIGVRRASVVLVMGLWALTGCSSGPSEQDCESAKIAQAKFFQEDDPKMREAYYANQVEYEAKCKEWRESQ